MDIHVVAIFLGLPLLAYCVKGIVGAASAIVFNAVLLALLAFTATGEVTLLDGLLWVGLADTLTSVVMALLLRRELRFEKPVLLLLAGMLPVSVTFSILLGSIDVGILTWALAVAVILAGLWLVLRADPRPLAGRTLLWLAFPLGLISGVLSGLFAMAGPVVILYLAAGTSDPKLIRSRLVFISTCATVTRAITLAATGEYTPQRLSWFALSLPAVAIGLGLGLYAHRFFSARAFRVALGALVLLAGLAAALKSLMG